MSTLGCGSCKKCRRQLRLLVKWDEISVGGGCCRSYSMLRSKKRIQAIVVVVVILRRLNCASIRLAARALSPCRFSATTPPRQKAHMLFNRHQVKRLRWSHASGSGQILTLIQQSSLKSRMSSLLNNFTKVQCRLMVQFGLCRMDLVTRLGWILSIPFSSVFLLDIKSL